MVHCPSNHMRLAKGVTPVPRLLAAGANVGMGIDQMDDLFAELRQEILLQGLHHSNPGIVSPRTSLEMATARGAVVLRHRTASAVCEMHKHRVGLAHPLRRPPAQPNI